MKSIIEQEDHFTEAYFPQEGEIIIRKWVKRIYEDGCMVQGWFLRRAWFELDEKCIEHWFEWEKTPAEVT